MKDPSFKIAVLISGRGSNLQSILDAVTNKELPVEVAAVISNKADAEGLHRADVASVPAVVVDDRKFDTRESFDHELMRVIDGFDPDLVVLAGFMRILGKDFVRHYEGRLINIHPALLPDFPGLNTHARALSSGAARHGASVHFVTPEVDAGPVIIQRAVPILESDTAESLAARVLEQEHQIYPLAIRWIAEKRVHINGDHVLIDGIELAEQGLIH